MAENYFPSSTGLGQGGAQVLKGRTPQLSASGIVRGIEQVGKDIREEQTYQREIDALKQVERNKRIASLDESIGSFQVNVTRKAAEKVMQDFWSGIETDATDWDSKFSQAMSDVNALLNTDQMLVKDKDKALQGEFRYGDERLSGQDVYSNLLADELTEDMKNVFKEGGAKSLSGFLLQNFSTISPNYYKTPAAPFKFNQEMGKYWAQKLKNSGVDFAEEIQISDDLTAAKVYRSIPADKQKEYKLNLEKDPIAQEFFFQNSVYDWKNMTPELKQEIWKNVVYEMIPPSSADIKSIRQKDDGKGKGLKEGEDYVIDEGSETPVSPRQEEWGMNKFKRITFKKKFDIPVKSGDSVVKAEIISVKKKGDEYIGLVLNPDDKQQNKPQTFTETEVELNDQQIREIEAQGYDLENMLSGSTQQNKIDDDAIYYLLEDGTKVTLEDIDRVYSGNIPEGAEKVTEENQAMMEANRPQSAKDKEAGESGINWE